MILSALLFPLIGLAAVCGDRIQGVNEYERMEKGKIVEGFSLFKITEWSKHTAFEVLLVKKTEKANLEIEIELIPKSGSKEKKMVKSWPTISWDKNPEYRSASGFSKTFFSESYFGGKYIIRLKDGAQVSCEDSPRNILAGD